jgi:hypothetical protein
MARSFLTVIAEAAGLNEPREPAPYPGGIVAAPPAAAAPAQVELSVPEQIIQNWKCDPNIRAEFISLATYAAFYTQDAARKQGISVSHLNARQLDLSAYLAKREGTLSPGEKTAIEGYAETWRSSPDIRAEFGSFEVYAGYMRSKWQHARAGPGVSR